MADTEFRYGMILGCVFSLSSLVLLCFYKSENLPKFDARKVNSIEIRTLLIIAALLLSTLFWMSFEWGAFDIMKIYKTIDQTHAVKGIEMSSYYIEFNGIFCVTLGAILAFAWFTIKMSPWLKLTMGFGLGVLGYGLMFFISGEERFAYNITLVSIALMALAELLISPIILSIITVNSHPKYLATVFGLVFLFMNIFTRLQTSYLPNDKLREWIGISGIPLGVLVFLGLAIFTFLGWLIFRNEKPNVEEVEL